VRELPRGTVTFLFTDIEGSTRLLDQLGAEEYGNVLAEHRRVLREAFERHGGVEVDTKPRYRRTRTICSWARP
jgi:class 3 adenylate cyclase